MKKVIVSNFNNFKLAVLLFIMLGMSVLGHSSIVVTEPSLYNYPCATYPTVYNSLGNIVITEGADTDFANSTANATFIFSVPANFEFDIGGAAPTVTFLGGGDITAASLVSRTATAITIQYTTNGNPAAMDAITIGGIRVRALAAVSGSSYITRSGGTAVVVGGAIGATTYGILYSQAFPSANAGTDQIVCAATATFEASPILDPTITGLWTPVSGGGTITTPSSPTSTLTGMPLGDNVFRWTITKGACTSNAIVTITSQASGIGCTSLGNQFSAVTAISPAPASQNIVCPPSNTNITTFTLANPGPFNVGDKVLVIQMQGATVNTVNAAVETAGFDNVFGSITDYNGAGNYEYAIIATKVGSDVTFSQNLINAYNPAGKVQLVTVPQFANYTINTPVNGTAWNSTTGTGGVMVFEVAGTLTLNNTISMDFRGFLGGGSAIYPGAPLSGTALNTGVWIDGGSTARCGMGVYSAAAATRSTGLRGEGIAASASHLYGRGALANGGGSGGGWNSGAGGGSNICAGGRGGYEFSSCHNNMGVNPFYTGVTPTYNGGNGLPAQNLNARMHGIGGYALTATANRVFMGGGGGAANGDGNAATAGGNGGGIIIITAGTIAGTSGIISANGHRGYANNLAPYPSTVDATGAGGAGGSIILDVNTYSIGSLTVRANGGKGGNQDQPNACHGNGGGGGGGLIRTKGVSPNVTISAVGGNIGVQRPSPNTNPDTDASLPLSNDGACAGGTTYGAMPGGSCGGNAQVEAIVVPVKACCSPADLGPDQSLCGLASIVLTNGTLSNTNKTFRWYKNGILIGGATSSTYTATTAGLYTVVVDSTVAGFTYCSVTNSMLITNAFPAPFLGPDQQLCSPSFLNLSPSNIGAYPVSTTWQWSKDGSAIVGATTPYLNNITSPGTYTLTASASGGCGPTTGSITITAIVPTGISACRSDCGTLSLSISGGNGGPYEWYANSTGGAVLQTGTTYTTPSICTSTTYWVQDNGLYQTTIGPPLTMATSGSLGGTAGNRNSNSVDNQVVFDVLSDIYLRGITVQYWANNCSGSVSYQINISNATSGYTTQSRSGTAGPCGPGLQTYIITFATPIFIPAGTGYRIDPNGSGESFAWYDANFVYPSTYSEKIKFIKNNSSDADAFPGYFDWQISYAAGCGRIPVLAEIGGSCATSPVSLISFDAEHNGTNVLLTWSTSTETNNANYLVQRSFDGIHFETIGQTAGRGNSSSISYYSFVDYQTFNSVVYYRLVQIDFDGKETNSSVVSASNNKASVINVFPNPFNSGTNVFVQSNSYYKLTIRLTDISGKQLFSSDEYTSNQTISLGEDLAEGVYIVEVKSEFDNKSIRIVKMNR